MIKLSRSEIISMSCKQQSEWVLACEQEQMDRLRLVAREIDRGGFRLVALAGPSCSGKTTTAHRLIQLLSDLGKNVKVLSTDDYFHNLSDYPLTHDGAPDFDHFDCLNRTLLTEILRKISRGESVSLSRFDFLTGRRTDNVDRFCPEENTVVILEGIHALNDSLYDQDLSYYKLALNVTHGLCLDEEPLFDPREIRLMRRIIRDEKKRNYRAEQTMNIWKNVARGEENFIFPFFENVNSLLSTGLDYEACVWKNDALDSLYAIPSQDPYRPLANTLIEKLEKLPELPLALVPEDSILQEFLGKNNH